MDTLLCLTWRSSNDLLDSTGTLEKTLMLGGIGGKRRRGRQRMRWLDGITDSMDMSLGDGSLNREDSLEKGMATQSSILAWEIPWTEDPLGGTILWVVPSSGW